MGMCITLSASVTLNFLFFPKLYIIIFKPEKNNRALFTTNKYIRCHIGKGANVEPAKKNKLFGAPKVKRSIGIHFFAV